MAKKNQIIIDERNFAIVKAKKRLEDAFAVIDNGNEITCIVNQAFLGNYKKYLIKAQKNYRLITFDTVLPFALVGFIAKISDVLAKEKIPIFVLSAYSTDYVLLKEEYLKKAIKALAKIGFETRK
jgi:uncharacterized protein